MLLGSGPMLNTIHLIHEQTNKAPPKLTVSLVLYLIFNGEPLQDPYALGFLIAAWAGTKITECSE